MKYKALVTAELNKSVLDRSLGDSIDFVYRGYNINHEVMPHDELAETISDYDILVCEYDTVSSDVFANARKLKMIVCCRGGISSVLNIDKAMECGVIVCNNSGRNAGAVTDMVMGYILDMTRNITKTNELIHARKITQEYSTKPKEYKDTVWGLDNNSPFIKFRGRSINKMTLGIVGFGHAGSLLAKKANAFNMRILAYDPYYDFINKPEYVTNVSWETILSQSDILSVHCVLTSQTKNMFGKKQFMSMKDHAYFINTSRGELVVEEDLVDALRSNKLSGAAIDVTRNEPIPSDSILLDVDNLLITPHIAGSSDDVIDQGTKMVIDSLTSFLLGEKPKNCIVYR